MRALQVPEPRLQGRDRGQAGGFRAQHPRTQADAGEAGGVQGVPVARRPAAFGPDEHGDIGLRDLVEAAQLTGALPDIDLVTVSIDEITPMHLTLSPAVQAALPAVREAVIAALARQEALGHA